MKVCEDNSNPISSTSHWIIRPPPVRIVAYRVKLNSPLYLISSVNTDHQFLI